jgi:hypothetical protein
MRTNTAKAGQMPVECRHAPQLLSRNNSLAFLCFLGLALAACAPAQPNHAATPAPGASPSEPGAPEGEGNTLYDTLTECAGALAAKVGLDPANLISPQGEDTPETNLYWIMLALADKEAGVADGADGPATRAAAAEAKARFLAGTEDEREKVIADCRTRFAPF